MNELERKDRMISVRVSDEEYASLKLVYRKHGARSISDFARLSMQRVAAAQNLHSDVIGRVEELEGRVEALERKSQIKDASTRDGTNIVG
jgi:hypothetical protein